MDATTTINETVATPSWTEVFLGIITRPFDTLRHLDAAYETGRGHTLAQQAFSTVLLSSLLLGLIRFDPGDGKSLLEVIGAVSYGMVIWVVAAGFLSLLSTILSNARKTRWSKALVLTGWSFTPLMLFAPMTCFKNAFGAWVLPLATIPTWWTIFLLFASYKIALNVKSGKLFLLALIMPPLLFLVYIFWTGLSFIVLLSEIISAFQR